jgi:hypothetical protein
MVKSMENNEIPFFVMESAVDRLSTINKRLWILCILLTILLVVSNLEWLHYESQFEDVVTTQEVSQTIDSGEGGGGITVTGIGDIYGEGETDNNKNN